MSEKSEETETKHSGLSTFDMVGARPCRLKDCNELSRVGRYCSEEHSEISGNAHSQRVKKISIASIIFIFAWQPLVLASTSLTAFILGTFFTVSANMKLGFAALYFGLFAFAFVRFIIWTGKE